MKPSELRTAEQVRAADQDDPEYQAEYALQSPPDLLEAAMGLICNAGWNRATGDVTEAKSEGWHEAADRWMTQYGTWLSAYIAAGGERVAEDPL